MKTTIIKYFAISILWVSCFFQTDTLADDRYHDEYKKLKDVKAEISLLNLLNGLYLSQGQLEQLAQLAQQASQIRQQRFADVVGDTQLFYEKLTTLRDALYRSTGATRQETRDAAKYNLEVIMKPTKEMLDELGKIEDKARVTLNDSQIAIIETFEPCLVPPKNLRDPVAVGQASTTDREEKLLDTVRRMPNDLYEKQKLDIAKAIVEEGEKEKGKLPDDIRKTMIESYCKKMDSVRRMSAIDFEIQKQDTAKSFTLFDDDVTYHHGKRKLGTISRYLLTDTAADVLPRWLNARLHDPAKTTIYDAELHDNADTTNRPPGKTERQNQIKQRYERLTYTLLQQRSRMGKLKPTQDKTLRNRIRIASNIADNNDRFLEFQDITEYLNDIAITPESLKSLVLKIRWQSQQKNVKSLFYKQQHDHLSHDVTGLSDKIAQARQIAKEGNIQGAYDILVAVSEYLDDFAN